MGPFIYNIDLSAGPTFVASLLSTDAASKVGLRREAIIGTLARDSAGEPIITPARFMANELVELPTDEAYAPIYAAIARTGMLLLLGLIIDMKARWSALSVTG